MVGEADIYGAGTPHPVAELFGGTLNLAQLLLCGCGLLLFTFTNSSVGKAASVQICRTCSCPYFLVPRTRTI